MWISKYIKKNIYKSQHLNIIVWSKKIVKIFYYLPKINFQYKVPRKSQMSF